MIRKPKDSAQRKPQAGQDVKKQTHVCATPSNKGGCALTEQELAAVQGGSVSFHYPKVQVGYTPPE
jgi:hypothetical protein